MNSPPARNYRMFCEIVVKNLMIHAVSTYGEKVQFHALRRDIGTTRAKKTARSTYGGKIEILVVLLRYILLGLLSRIHHDF